MAKKKTSRQKLKKFAVEVTETFHDRFIVKARDRAEVYDIVDEKMNSGELDCTERGEYDRTIDHVYEVENG